MKVPQDALRQRLILGGTPLLGIWTCKWCAAEMRESAILHRADCLFVTDIAGAERDRIIGLVEDADDGRWDGYGATQVLSRVADLIGDDT